jgi:hypothetical protein
MPEATTVKPDTGKDKPSATEASQAPTSISQKFLAFVNASHLKFVWFLGNITVVISFFAYLLSYRSNGLASVLWYKLLFAGASTSFGIVLYQNKSLWSMTSKSAKVRALLQDDNTHYLYNAFIWLIFPKRTLAIVPYYAYSIFHVLSVLGFELLPALSVAPAVANKIQGFVKKYHELSRRVAATSELLLLVWLIIRLLTWKKWSFISLSLYAIFIKVKSEGSLFTQQILKNWEVRVDGLVSSPKVPPQVKQYWGFVKNGLKTVNRFSLIKRAEQQAAATDASATTTTEKKK